MNVHLRRHWAVLVVLAIAALSAFTAVPAAAADEGHFDRTLTVTGPVSLDVQTGSGSITVRAGGSGSVEVHGKIRADNSWSGGSAQSRIQTIEQNPPIQQDGNKIVIGRTGNDEKYNHISISYEIVTPRDTQLHSASGSGEETIEGVAGPVDATSGSGDLRLSNIGGEVRAHTGSGEIELNGTQGAAHVATGSGGIHAMGIAGPVNASTGSGDVRIEQTAAGDVEISTGSGEVTLDHVKGAARVRTGSGSIHAEGEPTGAWSLHTGSGDVAIKLPPSAAFDLAAYSSSGSIHTNREVLVSGETKPHELHGKVNGGGVLVELHTSSGTIRVD